MGCSAKQYRWPEPKAILPQALSICKGTAKVFRGLFLHIGATKGKIRCMRHLKLLIAGYLLFPAPFSTPAATQGRATSGRATLFEGARLIAGDGRAPIESSAFLVENNRFTRVGRKGEIQAPAGAARVDLSGKTVIPALVDAHSHIGYMKNLTSGPQNYTRENILDHMYRFAYFGVGASQAMGSDFGDLPYQLREELQARTYPDAARFLTAGRGLAPEDEVRPDNIRHSAYTIRTEADIRQAVQELAARHVTIVKTWVDEGSEALRSHPLLKGITLPARLGTPGNAGLVVTKGGVVFVGSGEPYLYAFDKATGREVSRVPTPFRVSANPMTYKTRSGRQFVVVATGAGPDAALVGFTLGSR